MTDQDLSESEVLRLQGALKESRSSAPPGFAFRFMQRLLTERLHRTERTARWHALLFAIFISMAAGLAVLGLSLAGLTEVQWLQVLPMDWLIISFCITVGLLGLDRFLVTRFSLIER